MQKKKKLKKKMKKTLIRSFALAYFVWARAYRSMKKMLKDVPAHHAFEKELDKAGTHAQVALFQYETLQMDYQKTFQSAPIKNHTERPSPSHILREVFHK